MKKEPIILVGGGGHCVSCIDVIEAEGRFNVEGIVDVKEKIGQSLLGYSYIGSDDDLPALAGKFSNFLITIGQIQSPGARKKIFSLLDSLNVTMPTIVSPLAYVSKHAIVGRGSIVMHHALVNARAVIGINCIINTKALIEHDAEVSDHCHISTASIINGGVKVGEGSFFGSGAVSKQGVMIPAGSFVKAGTVFKG
jgi:sugar O-acyltransferase (sialic acid O-acetyltransferase NeuD family)